jgi:succinate dehydrogenase / fumarate reductase, cytochrome b subunit
VAQAIFDGTSPSKRRAPFLVELYRSAIGKKYVMAISGMGMVLFALVHMIGNLKMYQGAKAFNHYAEFLREMLYPLLPKQGFLWISRIGLLSMVLIHMHAAYSLTMLNRRSRVVGYQAPRAYQAANFASRSMRLSGLVVLFYILFHLADLTLGWVNPGYVSGDPYRNVTASFDRLPVTSLYIVANIAFGVHLFHGAWSFFQTIGWNNPRFNAWRRGFAYAITGLIVAGNVSFPLAVQFGIVG